MAGGQGAAGCGHSRPDRLIGAPLAYVGFSGADQAGEILRFAHENNCKLNLYASTHLTYFAGVGFLRAIETRFSCRVLVNCGDRAGLVMAGLRQGLRHFVYADGCVARERLQSMVAKAGGDLLAEPPRPVICPEWGECVEISLKRGIRELADTGLSSWTAGDRVVKDRPMWQGT